MRNTLNTPPEVGVRVLCILVEAVPDSIDLHHLVFLDYALLHSADFGGPESLNPAYALRVGEFGMKRQWVREGLLLMIQSGLVQMSAGGHGFEFCASERAEDFLDGFESAYVGALRERARWVVECLWDSDDAPLVEWMRDVYEQWAHGHDVDEMGVEFW